MRNFIARICIAAYDVASLFLRSLWHIGYILRRSHLLFKQLYEVGNRSLMLVSVMGGFMGMILALQVGYITRQYNLEQQIGLIGLAIIKEFGPVITAFILAGRIGSSYAAEIGTMKVYEEIDALKVMGVKPTAYLASPRILACIIMLPILAIYADFVGMLGGAFISKSFVGVEYGRFFQVFFQYLDMKEIWRSMVKCLFFGSIISVTGCYFGFKTEGGAEGVGRSTTDSVVHALLAVLIADYFIEKVLMAF